MNRRFSIYAWAVLAFNIIVILWGALVRASRSGDGCGNHWPLCNGVVAPDTSHTATFIEFAHRVSTAQAGLAVVVLAIWAWRAYGQGAVRWAAFLSLFFIITEGLLGAGLVLLRYVGEDASTGRAVYLSLHLINTLLMLGAMALTAWWASGNRIPEWPPRHAMSRWLMVALAGMILLGVSGAITALGDTLFPVTSISEGLRADMSPASHIFVRLRVWHPFIALLVSALTILTAVWIGGQMARITIGLVIIQLAMGALNLWMLAPLQMQLVHLLFADLLWVAVVLMAASALAEKPVSVSAGPESRAA